MIATAKKYKKCREVVKLDHMNVANPKVPFKMYQTFQKHRICLGKYYIFVMERFFCFLIKVSSSKKIQLQAVHVIPKDQYKFISWMSNKFKLSKDQFQFLIDSIKLEIHFKVIQEIRTCAEKIGGIVSCLDFNFNSYEIYFNFFPGKFQDFVERVINPEILFDKNESDPILKPVDTDEKVEKEANSTCPGQIEGILP